MPIPLVVGPNMNIREDQHHQSSSWLLVTVPCASILLCRLGVHFCDLHSVFVCVCGVGGGGGPGGWPDTAAGYTRLNPAVV